MLIVEHVYQINIFCGDYIEPIDFCLVEDFEKRLSTKYLIEQRLKTI